MHGCSAGKGVFVLQKRRTMTTRKKIVLIVILVIAIIAGMIAAMFLSYQHGKNRDTAIETSITQEELTSENTEVASERSYSSNDEALGKITGEDDDFTMVADPANFDVKITGFEGNITLLTSTEDVLHQQMEVWMDENEFWDMTEVSYTGKYLRDEASQSTTVYFQISRYPNSPLLATWNPNTEQYSFTIEWH